MEVGEVVSLLRDASTDVLRTGVEQDWDPEPGSSAHRERTEGANPAYAYPWLLTVAACEHLNAAADLLERDPPPVWSSLPILRSAMDSAIRAWWVLDPSHDALHRRARGYELARMAIAETRRIPGYDEAAGAWRELRGRINADGIPIRPAGDEGPIDKIDDIAALKFKSLYEEFFGDPGFAAPVYGWLSGVGHGDVWLLSESVKSEKFSATRRLVTPRLVLPFAAFGSKLAVEVTVAAFSRWSGLFGWQADWKPREQALLKRAEAVDPTTEP
jgi:hypothetical protein